MTLRTIISAVTLAALITLALPADRAVAGGKIAVLVSSKDAPYGEALKGFQGFLRKQARETDFEVYELEGNADNAHVAVQKIEQGGVRMVVTLGSLATEAALREISDLPIVACMVLRTDSLTRAPNATGVGLEFPLETQFSWLQRLLPQARSIGVLYNPDENGRRVEDAARIAKKLGLRLDAQEVDEPQEIPAALNSLSKNADVLWGVADKLALSPLVAKNILLFSFRNRIPFIGLSSTWVKAGALYSLDWDYADIGAQCGELAVRVLEGAPPSSIPPASPRKVMYSLNLVIARQLKIKFSDEIVRGAQHVY